MSQRDPAGGHPDKLDSFRLQLAPPGTLSKTATRMSQKTMEWHGEVPILS